MPAVFRAGGNIYPASFVKIDPTADNQVVQATAATDKIIGVSQKGTDRAPYNGLDSNYAAVLGEELLIYQVGETCWITTGGSVTAGDKLVATTNGAALGGPTDGQYYGGHATQTAPANKFIEMMVQPGQQAN